MDQPPSIAPWASFVQGEGEFAIGAELAPDGELRLVYASEAVHRALGYADGELIGQPAAVICGERTAEADRARFRNVLISGEAAEGGTLLYTRSGEVVYSEWNARRVDDPDRGTMVTASGRIVDRRRPADGDLRSLIAAIEHATDAILVYEMAEGSPGPRVQYANRAAELMTGFSRDALAQASRIGPKSDAEAMEAIVASMQRGESVRSRQLFYRSDGSIYWVEINARPLLESVNGMWRWIFIERDITEAVEREGLLTAERDAYSTLAEAAAVFLDSHDLQKLESAYAHARAHLLAAGRRDALEVLESMYESALRRLTLYKESIERRNATVETQTQQSDAMAMLAHDIRGPLNTVIGYAELIAETDEASESGRHARSIVRAANRVVDLTNEVIVAAQLDRNEYQSNVERFDLRSLIESVVALQPGGERAQFNFPADHIEVEGDMSGIRHIVSNLTSNALKYSDAREPVDIVAVCDETHVRIEFRDRGIGVPSDEIATIFERFNRASNARASKIRGTGLGLYFVKQLVERAGGTIELESRVGAGTTVAVTLPLAPMGSSDVPVVLSIEPAGEERSLIAMEMRDYGYVVRVVQTIAAAEVAMRHERVRLVIADVDLFDDESLGALWQACRDRMLPVLMTGAHCDSAEPTQLRKPFVADDLLSKVEAIVPLLAAGSSAEGRTRTKARPR